MTQPKHSFYQGLSTGGFHNIHYTDWGDPANPNLLICAHGLTRCSRDFDTLAALMSDKYRVICPDVVGRGESDWLENKVDYNYAQYINDMAGLLARVTANGAKTVHWVGTSMGGIIGMLLAAHNGTPISRMVLNDVGAFIPKASLERIGMYLGASPRFADFESVVMAVRAVSPFGELPDETWNTLTAHLVKQLPDGSWMFRYDPGIGDAFKVGPIEDVDLTAVWADVECPVLLLRGADSDLLLKETFDDMCSRPTVRGLEFANVGHAPMLQSDDQLSVIREFFWRCE